MQDIPDIAEVSVSADIFTILRNSVLFAIPGSEGGQKETALPMEAQK